MPAVGVVSETEAAVSVSLIEGVGVGVAAETESVTAVIGGAARRVLDEVLDDGEVDHLADHEALAALHNAFDLRTVPSMSDALLWDGTTYTAATPVSPYAGTWFDALFVRPDTVHVNDDEFVGTTIDPVWTETLLNGATTWTQGLGRLSVAYNLQSSSQSLSTILKPITAAYPLTIETAMQTHTMNGYSLAGLCMTEGTTSTSQSVSAVMRHDAYDNPYLYLMNGTLTDGDSGGYNTVTPNEQPHPYAFQYIRLIWTASNTFKFLVSHDAVSWVDYFGGRSVTMSPTHIGMVVSANNSYMQMASFEYIRVTQSDLS